MTDKISEDKIFKYTYRTAEERNDHITKMLEDGKFICIKFYGNLEDKNLTAEFIRT